MTRQEKFNTLKEGSKFWRIENATVIEYKVNNITKTPDNNTVAIEVHIESDKWLTHARRYITCFATNIYYTECEAYTELVKQLKEHYQEVTDEYNKAIKYARDKRNELCNDSTKS